jgi:hypothetical protein
MYPRFFAIASDEASLLRHAARSARSVYESSLEASNVDSGLASGARQPRQVIESG